MTKSFKGYTWLNPEPVIESFPGVSDKVVAIARNRGVQDLEAFFSSSLAASMPDPYELKDMEKAANCLADAVMQKKNIAVYGDFDVDGATSTAQYMRFLAGSGLPTENLQYYIPQRHGEGYGPNKPAIKKLKDDGVDLILFTDCGTAAIEEIAYGKSLGLEIVIMDHHKQDHELPDAIVVNPNRKDEELGPPVAGREDYPKFYYLCAAGLAFLTCTAIRRVLRERGHYKDMGIEEYDIRTLLGLAALGTVADVMDLVGFNRQLVKCGIPRMMDIVGLDALGFLWELPEEKWDVSTCGFKFGPCLNAGGRIDDAMLATKLLILGEDEQDEALSIATHLFETNRQRQEIQKRMEASAMEQAETSKTDNIAVVYGEDWHSGVVGIVASKIQRSYDVAAVVIGAGGKGSCRSFKGYDVGASIQKAVHEGLLVAGGGHEMAAGLTIDPAKLDEFRGFMQKEADGYGREATRSDLTLECGDITLEEIEGFRALAPFGVGNPKVTVTLTNCFVSSVGRVGADGNTIKGKLSGKKGDIEFIMFGAAGTDIGKALISSEGMQIDVLGELSINEFRGRKSIQIIPSDIRLK